LRQSEDYLARYLDDTASWGLFLRMQRRLIAEFPEKRSQNQATSSSSKNGSPARGLPFLIALKFFIFKTKHESHYRSRFYYTKTPNLVTQGIT